MVRVPLKKEERFPLAAVMVFGTEIAFELIAEIIRLVFRGG